MQKRGSHIDIVISFVIFVTLLIFIFSIFAPKLKISDQQAIIDYIRAKLIGNFSSNLTTFTIQICQEKDENGNCIDVLNPDKNCVKVQSIIDDLWEYGITQEDLIIKNSTDSTLDHIKSGEGILVNIGDGSSFDGFLKFYYSLGLNYQCTGEGCDIKGCRPITPGQYEFGLIREITSIILFNIQKLADKYKSDYEGLKVELGIPPGTEFSFTFATSDGTIIIVAEPTEIPTTNVYAEEIPVTYTDNDGNVLEGFLTIKVW